MIARLRDRTRIASARLCRSVMDVIGSLNRMIFIAVAVAGFVALALSVRHSWFAVPLASQVAAVSAADIRLVSPQCTVWFQAMVGAAGICIAASWLWKRQWTLLSTALASILCLLALCYPYVVMVRHPVISAEASWLQMQHDNLLWLGGDIYNNAELSDRGWKSKVYMVDTPRQLTVIPLPSWSPWEIGLQRCQDLLLWLGYSNSYCQFVQNGWFLALLGGSLLLLTSLQRAGEFAFHRAGVALAMFTVSAVVAAIVGWSLPFRASRLIREANDAFSDGDYQQSLSRLNQAAALVPPLGQDTYYVAQRGVLEQRLGIDSEYADLRTAISLESDARYDQAFQLITPLVRSADPAIRREALRGMMRFAIQDYNSGRFEQAEQRFNIVLGHQPCNVKLLYLMQILAIRQSRPAEIERLRDWIYAASDHFRFGTRKVLRAAAQQNSVIAAAMREDPAAIWSAQAKARRP